MYMYMYTLPGREVLSGRIDWDAQKTEPRYTPK